jgi:predicted Kef-type K+ transport protein
MKTKFLFWCAILFLALGLSTSDSTLFFFFSIHFFMLFIGMFVHTRSHKSRPAKDVEPLPEAPSTSK